MTPLFLKIQKDLASALKAQDKIAVSTLRLLISEINNQRISKGEDLTDSEIVDVTSRQAKKNRESIEAFQKANREELVKKEKDELNVLNQYLPKMLEKDEIGKIVDVTIAEVGADKLKNMGTVMAAVMAKVKGRADGAVVAEIVKAKLLQS